MAIAAHRPEKLQAKNRAMLSMSKKQLHEFAETKETDLPKRKRAKLSQARMNKQDEVET